VDHGLIAVDGFSICGFKRATCDLRPADSLGRNVTKECEILTNPNIPLTISKRITYYKSKGG